jgi:hypothetical protein
MLADVDDPIMKDFVDNLEAVNGIADFSPGFVWRLETDEGMEVDWTLTQFLGYLRSW